MLASLFLAAYISSRWSTKSGAEGGGRKVSDAESGQSFIKHPSTPRLSRILRNETKRERESHFPLPLPFYFRKRSRTVHRTSKIRKAKEK